MDLVVAAAAVAVMKGLQLEIVAAVSIDSWTDSKTNTYDFIFQN